MGGQAWVLYGAAEFSRDTDLATNLVKSKKTQRDKDWPMRNRTLLRHAFVGDSEALGAVLEEEMQGERIQDQIYWMPLKRKLE